MCAPVYRNAIDLVAGKVVVEGTKPPSLANTRAKARPTSAGRPPALLQWESLYIGLATAHGCKSWP